MYAVQHLVTAKLRDVHVAGMRVDANDKLEITGERLGEPGRVPHPGHLGYIVGCSRRRVRCQGGLERTGGGGGHLGAGVAHVPRRAGRAEQITQGAATEGRAEAGARAAVWVTFCFIYSDLRRDSRF